MFLIAKLIGLFPISWPEPVRKLAAWVSLAVAVAGLLWAAKAAYDASVIRKHEDGKAIESIDARDQSAEERAADIIKHTIAEKEATDAINSVSAGDAQRRLDCLRLHRLGRDPEPCRRYRRDGGQADPE